MKIYHITERSSWEKALQEGFYIPLSFSVDGFIHCSTESQVLDVANRFYCNSDDLLLLQIDSEKLTIPLIFENLEGGSEGFPHIYGRISITAVTRVMSLVKSKDGLFTFPIYT